VDQDGSPSNQLFVDALSVISHQAKYSSWVITYPLSFSFSILDFQCIILTFQSEKFIYLDFDLYGNDSKFSLSDIV
jgi:hypothetical protein